MRAFHGTICFSIQQLRDSVRDGLGFRGLYVTDSPAFAARYANAQATFTVDASATTPLSHAVIIEVEIPDDTEFYRRATNHNTLDVSEAWVKAAEIVSVKVTECSYSVCDCHLHAAFWSGRKDEARRGAQKMNEKFGVHHQLDYIIAE